MVIVSGATGYVGRYLCIYLKECGIEVLALGRSKKVGEFFENNNIKFIEFDIADDNAYKLLPTDNIDAFINLAGVIAEHEVPVAAFFDINTIGTYKTLDFCKNNNIQNYILSSSHKLYNDIDKKVISETDPIKYKGDHTPYIISKVAAENFVEYYNNEFGLNGKIFRFTGVHGYGEVLGHLDKDGSYKLSTFELFTEKAMDGEKIEVWGNQEIKRDHIYIKDLIELLRLASKKDDTNKGIFNAASGKGVSQLEEAQAIAKIFGKSNNISEVVLRDDLPGLERGYIYDISKTQNAFAWNPKFLEPIDMLKDYKKEWESGIYHHYHKINPEQRPRIM